MFAVKIIKVISMSRGIFKVEGGSGKAEGEGGRRKVPHRGTESLRKRFTIIFTFFDVMFKKSII